MEEAPFGDLRSGEPRESLTWSVLRMSGANFHVRAADGPPEFVHVVKSAVPGWCAAGGDLASPYDDRRAPFHRQLDQGTG